MEEERNDTLCVCVVVVSAGSGRRMVPFMWTRSIVLGGVLRARRRAVKLAPRRLRSLRSIAACTNSRDSKEGSHYRY